MKRLIFTLLYNEGNYVLSRNFRHQNIGDINWLLENYNLLEIDFRINVVSRCIDNNYFIFDESLSVYRFVPNSIMSDNKKYSKKWWFKRLQAHNYMKKIYELNNKVYSNFFDLKLTNLITKILN